MFNIKGIIGNRLEKDCILVFLASNYSHSSNIYLYCIFAASVLPSAFISYVKLDEVDKVVGFLEGDDVLNGVVNFI
jgi:hypothetical protein